MVIFGMSFLVFFVVVLDQWVKTRVRKTLDQQKRIEKGPITLSLVYNKGAFRGFLRNNPIGLMFLHTASILVVVVGWWISVGVKKERGTGLVLSLMLGGAIGNWIDRIRFGQVTDFFAVKWTKNLYYNIADGFIFLGGLGILFIEVKRYIR